MARFAGQALQTTPTQQKPVLPSFNAEDLIETPEMQPGPYYPGQDLDRDKYIRHNPKSGVASIEGQEVAALPAIPAAAAGLIKLGSKAYGAYQAGRVLLDGGAVNPGTKADYNNQDPTTKYNRRKQNDYNGPASRSPYHQ